MATTVKELIEILKKYEDPNEYVIWQYYTRHEFDYLAGDEHKELTNEEFGEVADKLKDWDIWEGVPDYISEAIEVHKQEKGQD